MTVKKGADVDDVRQVRLSLRSEHFEIKMAGGGKDDCFSAYAGANEVSHAKYKNVGQ